MSSIDNPTLAVPPGSMGPATPASKVLHRAVKEPLPVAVEGRGIMLRLSDGSEIIDASGGAAVACLGHGNERVAARIAEQARRLGYVHTGFFSSEPAEALAELLVGDEPGGLCRAFFISSGSEAMEAALKIARQYFLEIGQPERTHFIARHQSYHGNTLGALAASGNPARRGPYEPLLAAGFSRVSPCFPFHYRYDNETDADYVDRLARELEDEFQRVGPGRVAAFIAEPVIGATAGCVAAVPGYFKAMRAICDRHGALLILDEIMSGMGRTGTVHAWEQEGVTPDIQTLAKGLGGGYQPIGALLISRGVLQALSDGSGAFTHGHTYQAHPVACAAALEVQRIIREQDLVTNVRRMGKVLEDALRGSLGGHPCVSDVRGRGLFWAVEFSPDPASKVAFAPDLRIADRLKRDALSHGLGIYPTAGTIDGIRGDHLIVAPPYNVTAPQIVEIVDRLTRTLAVTFSDY